MSNNNTSSTPYNSEAKERFLVWLEGTLYPEWANYNALPKFYRNQDYFVERYDGKTLAQYMEDRFLSSDDDWLDPSDRHPLLKKGIYDCVDQLAFRKSGFARNRKNVGWPIIKEYIEKL